MRTRRSSSREVGVFETRTWLARLDRFLVSQDWLDHYGNVVQLKLPRLAFDCAPILLDCGGMRRGPCFENMWLKVEGFPNLMEGWWQGVSF